LFRHKVQGGAMLGKSNDCIRNRIQVATGW
jgi:hypothetical protein